MMERMKATRELIITKAYPKPIPLIRLRLALKAMTAASTSFPNLTTLVGLLSVLLSRPSEGRHPFHAIAECPRQTCHSTLSKRDAL